MEQNEVSTEALGEGFQVQPGMMAACSALDLLVTMDADGVAVIDHVCENVEVVADVFHHENKNGTNTRLVKPA
ncbi:hypothetical protein [Nitratireductor indicus]|uniref:hypothetical protein n=1 Tax=Nitratireductor indicus TaxID=721133 RepID=UPI002874C679|nr:hypothetical protein [Nitratireductor indicus]MDS1135545.1 hypothetical protein [Nitratireductor indicus]